VRAEAKVVAHHARLTPRPRSAAPAWHPAAVPARRVAAPSGSAGAAAQLVPAAAVAPVRRVVATLSTLAPATAPVTRAANDVLAQL
jgi:hypothetical protein